MMWKAILAFFKRSKPAPALPERLSEAARAEILADAKLLRRQGVTVRELLPGESPDDPEVETIPRKPGT